MKVHDRLSTRDLLLAIAVPVMLVAIACNMVVRYHAVDQSPWRGHGFGMYSTYEGVPGRSIRVTEWNAGVPTRVDVPAEARHLVSKVLVAPGDPETTQLARAALEQSGADRVTVEIYGLTADGGDQTLTFGLRVLERVELP